MEKNFVIFEIIDKDVVVGASIYSDRDTEYVEQSSLLKKLDESHPNGFSSLKEAEIHIKRVLPKGNYIVLPIYTNNE